MHLKKYLCLFIINFLYLVIVNTKCCFAQQSLQNTDSIGQNCVLLKKNTIQGSKVIFDNLNEPSIPFKNILAFTDPNVHYINGKWVMYIGGFTSSFKVGIYELTLEKKSDIASFQWESNSKKQKKISSLYQSKRSKWDKAGMGSPTYVAGLSESGDTVKRIYYTGLNKLSSRNRTFSIGALEQIEGVWVKKEIPVLVGNERRPNVLEPFVLFENGYWHLWYLSLTGDPLKGKKPDFKFYYSKSKDGLTNWSDPVDAYPYATEIFSNDICRVGNKWLHVITADADNTESEQGIWYALTDSLFQKKISI